MKKIFLLTFSIICFKQSFADFEKGLSYFESEDYNNAYEEFWDSFEKGDLRANSYLLYLNDPFKKHKLINQEKFHALKEGEINYLVDTKWSQGDQSLEASCAYIKFKKEKKAKNKIQYWKNLEKLHKEDIAHASVLLVKIAEEGVPKEISKKIKPLLPGEYYKNALLYANREAYLEAKKRNLLSPTQNHFATFLERHAIGEGEYAIANISKVKENEKEYLRWLRKAAIMGYRPAIDQILEKYAYLVVDQLPFRLGDPSLNKHRDLDILAVLFKGAYDIEKQGFYAAYIGNLYDPKQKDEEHNCRFIEKDLGKAVEWYKKAKLAGNFFAHINVVLLKYDQIFNKREHKDINSRIADIIQNLKDFQELVMINHPENSVEVRGQHIGYVCELLNLLVDCTEDWDSFVDEIINDIILVYGKEKHKNYAKYLKFLIDRRSLKKLTNNEIVKLLTEASETYAKAATELGKTYEDGLYDLDIDLGQSFYYYQKAYDLRETCQEEQEILFYNLGHMHLCGKGCAKSYENAYPFLKKAFELNPTDEANLEGLAYCCFYLGDSYLKESFECYQKLAKISPRTSMYFVNLGLFYLQGLGCKKNLSKAWNYFEKAYELENPRAAYSLGIMTLIKAHDKNYLQKALEYFKDVLNFIENDKDEDLILMAEKYIEAIEVLIEKKLIEVSLLNSVHVDPVAEESISLAKVEDVANVSNQSPSTFYEEVDNVDDFEMLEYSHEFIPQKKKCFSKEFVPAPKISKKEEKNKKESVVDKLNNKHRKTFDAIMNPKLGQDVKWDAFEKLMGKLMKEGDYIKPAGGSKVNVKYKDMAKQFHVPKHRKRETLCPGRLESARELLSQIENG